MRKRNIKYIIIAVLGVVLTIGVVFFTISDPHKPSSSSADSSDTYNTGVISVGGEVNGSDKNDDYITSTPSQIPAVVVPTPTLQPEEPFVPADKMDLDPSSITVFVNKEYNLPKKYVPEKLVTVNVYFNLKNYDERTLMRPEAAEALEKLFAAAKLDGYELSGVSGYRSYSRQYQIFTNNILTKGKEHTLKYSAVPGTSEHQTGLAIDISCKSLRYDLSTRFADTPEGKWVAQNAHRFGYIIRYPKGKAKITGYAYEPWHVRYVGKGLATYLYENDLTLEEYYNYTPGKDFDFEKLYADLINITPPPGPSVTPDPTEQDGIIVDENGEIIDMDPDLDLTPTITPEITSPPIISVTPIPEEETEDPDPIISVTPEITDIPENSDDSDEDLIDNPVDEDEDYGDDSEASQIY